jgi:hypothetical protein
MDSVTEFMSLPFVTRFIAQSTRYKGMRRSKYVFNEDQIRNKASFILH